jgi:glycerol-3-phosphate dehydrogenase
VEGKDNYEKQRMAVPEFVEDAKTLVPELQEADLQLAYTGLRPKLVPPNEPGPADFVIEPDREFPRVIHLIGIESPGLTGAASIALDVTKMVEQVLN